MTKRKKIFIICLSVVLLLTALLFFIFFFEINPDNYSMEKHIERISKRVEKRYMNGDYNYTSYEIYPLYNESDELKYFLVEFEPYGFVYVQLGSYNPFFQPFGGASMYLRDEGVLWQRYRISVDGIEPPSFNGICWKSNLPDEYGNINYPERRWEVDEKGEFVFHSRSPYKTAGVENEKIYLLKIYQHNNTGYIPAVKRDEKYLNLISMEEIQYERELPEEIFSTTFVGFPPKKIFDL